MKNPCNRLILQYFNTTENPKEPKFFLTEGKAGEGPFVSQILDPGETAVLDRYYQCYRNFDLWQEEGRHFVCRIKANARQTPLQEHAVPPDSHMF